MAETYSSNRHQRRANQSESNFTYFLEVERGPWERGWREI